MRRPLRVEMRSVDAHGVRADPELFRRVVSNLISNAIVRPRQRYDQREDHGSDGSACISLSNPGPGSAPEALPHVFERFFVPIQPQATPRSAWDWDSQSSAASRSCTAARPPLQANPECSRHLWTGPLRRWMYSPQMPSAEARATTPVESLLPPAGPSMPLQAGTWTELTYSIPNWRSG